MAQRVGDKCFTAGLFHSSLSHTHTLTRTLTHTLTHSLFLSLPLPNLSLHNLILIFHGFIVSQLDFMREIGI
jgi:hypothetical protein